MNEITVEVIYALPHQQFLKKLNLIQGSTVIHAIHVSKLVESFSDIDLEKNKIGIYGRFVKPDTVLEDRDRIEIYRPLIVDPKEARRKRAAKK